MSLLTVCQTLAADVGVEIPDDVASSDAREHVEMLSFANKLAEDISRRVDWGALAKTTAIFGTGTSTAFALPSDFARLIQGAPVVHGSTVVRPLSRAEWTMVPAVGAPRYFLLNSTSISFWPYLQTGDVVSMFYQSENWCTNGGAAFVSNDDGTVFPEIVLEKALIFHWRRQKGMPYADQEAEFEATLLQYAEFDDRRHI